jgi:hypothetical protein
MVSGQTLAKLDYNLLFLLYLTALAKTREPPKTVTLGIGVGDLRAADSQYFFQHRPIRQRRAPQIDPIPPLTASDAIINSRQG